MTLKNRNPHKPTWVKQNLGPLVAVVSATSLILSLLLFFVAVPLLIQFFVTRETRLVPGTPTFSKWVNVTVPIFIKFYIFNVTNGDAVIQGARCDLQEVGPYIWEEKRTKIILDVDDEEDSVTYREVITYHFRPDLSSGSQEDTLDLLNLPFYSAATLVNKHIHGVHFMTNFIIDSFVDMGEELMMRGVKVRDLLFDGVKLRQVYEILGEYEIVDLPPEFVDGTFALYNRKNGTPANSYKINRGIKDYRQFGQIMAFDGKKEVNFWTNSRYPQQYCNMVNGSDGNIFPPFLDKTKPLYAFNHEICRSIFVTYEKEAVFQEIPAYQYEVASDAMSETNPDNFCFIMEPGYGMASETIKGSLRMFSCKQDLPIVLSLPHFLYGSDKLLEGVNGIKPNVTLHKSSAFLEPTSGALLKITKRLQVNIEVQAIPGIDFFKNVPLAIVPIVWAEEVAQLSEKDLAEIRDRLVFPMQIINVLQWVVIGGLGFIFVISVIFTLFRRKESKEASPFFNTFSGHQ